MSKKVFYRQCKLKRDNCYQTSYIPEPYCVKNRILKLKNDSGVWENGWIVEEANDNLVEEKDVPDYHYLIKQHRKATGDSLSK